MEQLGETEPHYIKCIKPNNDKAPGGWSSPLVIEQLRYSGVLEVSIDRNKHGNLLGHLAIYLFSAPPVPRHRERSTESEGNVLLTCLHTMNHTNHFLELIPVHIVTCRSSTPTLPSPVHFSWCKDILTAPPHPLPWKDAFTMTVYSRDQKSIRTHYCTPAIPSRWCVSDARPTRCGQHTSTSTVASATSSGTIGGASCRRRRP